MLFNGIYTPLITPFHQDGTIDYDGFSVIIEHLMVKGVHGFISGGSTGEYYAQSLEERKELAKIARDISKNHVSLIVGTGAIRLQDSMAMAEYAAKIDADGILIGSPPYAVPTQRENALNALAIDRSANLPIMLYNYPGRMGISMDEEFLDRVGRSHNFQAIKESSGDINRVHLLARDYPHIQLACGMDDQALEFFVWGTKCWVCGGSNFLPEEHIALWRACVMEGDFDKGRRIMSALLPLMRILEQGGKFIQTIKYGCNLQGFEAGYPRPPLKPLNKDDKRQLEPCVRILQQTIAQIEKGE